MHGELPGVRASAHVRQRQSGPRRTVRQRREQRGRRGHLRRALPVHVRQRSQGPRRTVRQRREQRRLWHLQLELHAGGLLRRRHQERAGAMRRRIGRRAFRHRVRPGHLHDGVHVRSVLRRRRGRGAVRRTVRQHPELLGELQDRHSQVASGSLSETKSHAETATFYRCAQRFDSLRGRHCLSPRARRQSSVVCPSCTPMTPYRTDRLPLGCRAASAPGVRPASSQSRPSGMHPRSGRGLPLSCH